MKINRKLHDLIFAQCSSTEAFEHVNASKHHPDGGTTVFSTSFAGCGEAFGVGECLWTNITTCSLGSGQRCLCF